jgi:hypothetical protein
MLLDDLYRLAEYLGVMALFFAVLMLFVCWLRGITDLLRDLIARNTHSDGADLLVTEWGAWDIVYSSRSAVGRWVASMLEE